jgi:hypothetical protein
MPPVLTAAHLRKLADELDAEDHAAAEEELRAKVDRLEAAQGKGGLSPEQQAVLDRAQKLLDELDEEERLEREKNAGGGGAATVDTGGNPVPPAPPADKKTRPGRKSGMAYDWDVDDDGKVVKADTAIVWTGADEDDEVELPE